MVVRPEYLNTRSLAFSNWLRRLSDPVTGLTVTNLDWIFWNWKTRRLMFCEEKCKNAKIAKYFEIFCNDILTPALKDYCEKNCIDFRGFHVITFDNMSPMDSKHIYFDDRLVTEDELKKILKMEEPLSPKNLEGWM